MQPIFKKLKNRQIDKAAVETALLKILILVLEFVIIMLILYLLLGPLYPNVKYEIIDKNEDYNTEIQDVEIFKEEVKEFKNNLPFNEFDVSANRLIIPKIGVNAPIVESQSEKYGLSKGAWRIPDSSTPDKGGNTVITGHRFKYLPPHNVTFYLFHKLEKGDLFSITWEEKDYLYKIIETKVVEDTEVSILEPTIEPIVTLFTCHPIYSTDQRLVIIGELLEKEE